MAEGPGALSPDPARLPAWQLAALTTLAYTLVAGLSLALAGPPSYASPLYPAAGIALVACVVGGPAALPGVYLGSFIVGVTLNSLRGADGGLLGWLLPAVLAAGAALQAQLGAWLLRRHVGLPLVLNAPRDIALAGLLGGLLACTASATVATAALLAAGVLGVHDAAATWATWWLGDTLGVLIAAPMLLTLVGRPQADWRPRRRTLGLPLLAALALMALAMQQVRSLDAARQRDRFAHDSTQLSVLVQKRLGEALHALQALDAAARVAGQPPSPAQLQQASGWWLSHLGSLQATGVGVRVALADLEAFEARVRREGPADFRSFDRDDGSDRRARGELMVLRHLEPLDSNRAALGLNSLSVAAARAAIEAARDSGEPRATAAFRLTQSQRDEPGVVVYQALYAPGEREPATVAERRARWTGTVFVTLRTEPALAGLGGAAAARLSWCLLDADPAAPVRRLASAGLASACDEPAPGRGARALATEKTLEWGGRQWLLRLSAPAASPTSALGEVGLLSLAGLTAVTLLGALLLVVTGHARRTELAVAQSTERLRAEVAERRHAEAQQQETRERLQGILDNAPLGVLFLDAQGQVIEYNARFAEMAGIAPALALGDSVMALAHPEDRETLAAIRRDLLRGAATRSVAMLRLRAPGTAPRWTPVRVIASALRDERGDVLRVVAVVEDVADQLRLEASEQARLRAESANRAKNEFLSRMSHELRTPLNAMIGFAQLLGLDREPALAAHQRDWAHQIQRAGWHLLELINETLDLSRIESGSLSLAPQPLDLRLLAEAVRSLVTSAAAQRGIRIEVSADPGVPAALGDATRVRQVLTNLLTNAVKYNRPGGAVRVHVSRTGEHQVAVSVADTGLGMDAAQLSRLFQPYDRLGREGSGIEGTGIGLVIARRLLELMGGTLAVESQPGEGSVFTVTLPATDEPAAGEPDAVESLPAPYAQRLVHYVEDNPTNIEVMRGILAQRPQVRLEVSMLGLDGLAAIRREPPDLILLDMQLPDIAGPELLRFLKNDDTLAKIPVIVVSADATPDHVRSALTLGALHYLTKPVDVASFLAHVDEALESMETRWAL